MKNQAERNRAEEAGGQRRWTRSRVVWALSALLGLLAAAAAVGLEWVDRVALDRNQFESLSLVAYDMALNRRPVERPGETVRDERVILLQIGEGTLGALGLDPNEPVPRDYQAKVVRRLKALGAKVIAFDFVFRPLGDGETLDPGTAALVAAFREHGKVVVGGTVVEETVMRPDGSEDRQFRADYSDPAIRDVARTGWAQVTRDLDGAIRRFQWYTVALNDDAEFAPQAAFGPAAAALFHDREPNEAIRSVDRGRFLGAAIPRVSEAEGTGTETGQDPRAGSTAPRAGPTSAIEFVGGANRGFRIFKYEDLYHYEQLPAEVRENFAAIEGKLVVVGDVRGVSQDVHKVPVRNDLTGTYEMPGVQVQANVMHTILAGHYLAPLGRASEGWLLVLACLATTLLTRRLSPLAGLITAGAVLGGLALGSIGTMRAWGIWIDPTRASVGVVLAYVFEMALLQVAERRQQAQIRDIFSRVVDRRVVQDLLREDRAPELGGELREVTLLFSDLQGFTTISEQMPPAQLVGLLNEYFDIMLKIVDEHGGTLDKLMGDGIMAYFGAPQPQPDHARRAVECSLAMQAAMAGFRGVCRVRGLPPLFMRIGLHTGEAVVGLIGARHRDNYSVTGDVVNVAARLEGQNKEFTTQILMSEATYQAAQPLDGVQFRGETAVKGRVRPIPVYSVGEAQPVE